MKKIVSMQKETKELCCGSCKNSEIDIEYRLTEAMLSVIGHCRNCGKQLMIYNGAVVDGVPEEHLILGWPDTLPDMPSYGPIDEEHRHFRCRNCFGNRIRISTEIKSGFWSFRGVCKDCGNTMEIF